jgi:enoyl-CoA hydratase/carnithine racemase
MPLLWHASEPVNGILRVEINRHDKPVNTFSRDALEELDALLTRIRGDSGIRGVVFQSGKPGNFIAGADINEFKDIGDRTDINVADTAREASRFGQRVLQALENLSVPTLALISGPCNGRPSSFSPSSASPTTNPTRRLKGRSD